MPQSKNCEMPGCSGIALIKSELESSWTVEKYQCPNCGRTYQVPTGTGKTAQVAPLAIFGMLAVSILTLDIEGAIEHGARCDRPATELIEKLTNPWRHRLWSRCRRPSRI